METSGRELSAHPKGDAVTVEDAGAERCLDDGGSYCLTFGGAGVDRRFAQELLTVLTPLGIEASLVAAERLGDQERTQRQALSNKRAQLDYEAKRAFEQFNEVDPRHRLVADELERRWNAKLEELEAVTAATQRSLAKV